MRHHAHIKTTIWDDPEFVELRPEEQRLYFQLLTQKRLTMVGVMAYTPRNWARQNAYMDTETIETTIAALQSARYVLVDHETEEILIRTTVKHDPPRGFKSIRGMWNAWQMVDSKGLRRAILAELEPEILDNPEAPPPDEAKALLDAPYQDPWEGASMPLIQKGDSEQDSTPTNHLPQPPIAPARNLERDEMWDALTAAIGEAKTKTERSNRGRTVTELLEAGATPEQIGPRCDEYRRRYANAALTDSALRKHWSDLTPRDGRPKSIPYNGGMLDPRALA